MQGARAAVALLALAACIACTAAAPVNEQTGLDLYDPSSAKDGCYYNFQHYGEGDRIMTNEPCLNCTCHNRMLMCYLRVCPFTKPMGQDCTIEKRGDQCCPVITCPDVHVDLMTSTSTTSPAEYGSTDVGRLEKYGCDFGGKFFSEGSKMPSMPNKPCELCYCIRNMTACVMQECTLHVDGCTPVYHKDVCCPVRYSCDHPEDEMPMLDDMSTTVRPTPGFLLTTTAPPGATQDCIHQDEVFADGALIKTEKACEHCYCMKGDIVCVVQECGTPMENEGKNCTSMPPREGQCCPDTYICEGAPMVEDTTNELLTTYIPTQPPTRRSNVEGSGDDRTNIPYATTHSPLPEEEKEGSGFESEETMSPDDSIEDSSTPSQSSEGAVDIDLRVPDITTETIKTDEEEVITQEPASPEKEIFKPTEKVTEKEIAETVHEEPTTSYPFVDTVDLYTQTPAVEQLTEQSQQQSTASEPKEEHATTDSVPSITEKLEEVEAPIDISMPTPVTVKEGQLDEKTTESNYDQTTANIKDQSTENLTDKSQYKPTEKADEPITEKDDGQVSTIQYIDEPTKTIEETTTGKLKDVSTEKPDELGGPSTVSEDSSKISTENLENQSTEKISDETTENISDRTTEKISDDTTEKVEEKSTEKNYDQSTEQLDDKTTEEVKEIFTSKYDEYTTEKTFEQEPPTEKTVQQSTEKVDEQSSEMFSKPEVTSPASIASESEVTEYSNEDIATTGLPVKEVSGESTSIEPTESSDDKYTTSSPTVTDSENKSQEPVAIPETTELGSPESTSIESTERSDKPSYTTQTYLPEESEPTEMDHTPETIYTLPTEETVPIKNLVDATASPAISYTTLSQSTEDNVSIQTEMPLTDETLLSHVTTHGPPDDSSESIQDKTEIPDTSKQETIQPQYTTISEQTKPTESSIPAASTETTYETPLVLPSENEKTDQPIEMETESTSKAEITTAGHDLKIESTQSTEFSEVSTGGYSIPDSTESASTIGSLVPKTTKEQESTPKMEESTGITQKPDNKLDDSSPELDTSTEIPRFTTAETVAQPTTISDDNILTSVPDQSENEIYEEEHGIGHILPHIPGEGDCLVDGITYTNDSSVPSTNKCQSSCKCVSSIIKCDQIQCSPPPENMINCQPIHDAKESCCPTYVCDNAKETVAPESHNQMLDYTTQLPSVEKETETPGQPPLSVSTEKPLCDSENCEAKEEVLVPVSVAECTSDSCGPISAQSPIPNRSSDEKHPSGEDINIPVIPVVVNAPEECASGSCTPTREDSMEVSHIPSSVPVTELPVVDCAGEDCAQISDACQNGECKTPISHPQTEIPISTLCTGDKCDASQTLMPEDISEKDCTSGVCETPDTITDKSETQAPIDTHCIGDQCNIPEVVSPTEDCQGGGCEKPSHIVPEKQTPVAVSCEGDCSSLPISVPTCESGDCETPNDLEPITQIPMAAPCAGDGCSSAVIPEDLSNKQCNGEDCKKTDTVSPGTSASCEGDLCGTQTVIPEACKNGDCTDSNAPELPQPVQICVGDQCNIQITESPESPDGCESGDCKYSAPITPSSEIPIDISCIGELCNLPKVPETTSTEDCKESDCKTPNQAQPEISKPTNIPCSGDECSITEHPQIEADFTELPTKEATANIPVIPAAEGTVKPLQPITEPSQIIETTSETNLQTTELSYEITTPITEEKESESKAPYDFPNEIDDSNLPIVPTESSHVVEKETRNPSTDIDNDLLQAGSTSAYDESFSTPSGEKDEASETPGELTDEKITPELTTDSIPSIPVSTENQPDEDRATTLQTPQKTPISSTEEKQTEKTYAVENEQQTEGKLEMTVTEEPMKEETITENVKSGETSKPSLEESSIRDITTEHSAYDKTTPNLEIQQTTELDLTEGMQQQPATGTDAPTDSGDMSEATIAPSEHFEPAEQESFTTEKFASPGAEELTTISILREKQHPEIHSHTANTEEPVSNVESEYPTTVNVEPITDTVLESTTPKIYTSPEVSTPKEEDVYQTTIKLDSDDTRIPEFTPDQDKFTETPSYVSTQTPERESMVTEKSEKEEAENTEKAIVVDTTDSTVLEEASHPNYAVTDNINPSTETEDKPATEIPVADKENKGVESTISPELLSDEKPQEDIQKESSTPGSIEIETDKTPVQTEKIMEEHTNGQYTESPEQSFTTGAYGAEEQNVDQEQTDAPSAEHIDASSETNGDISVTTLPEVTPAPESNNLEPEITDAKPDIGEEQVTIKTPEVLPEKEITIPEGTEAPTVQTSTVDLSNAIIPEQSGATVPVPVGVENEKEQVAEFVTTEFPFETEPPVTKISAPTLPTSSESSDIIDKFNPVDSEKSTIRPDEINEITNEIKPSEEQLTTISEPIIGGQTEAVTNVPVTQPESEGQSLAESDKPSTESDFVEQSTPAAIPADMTSLDEEGTTKYLPTSSPELLTTVVDGVSHETPTSISQTNNDQSITEKEPLRSPDYTTIQAIITDEHITSEYTTTAPEKELDTTIQPAQSIRPDVTTEQIIEVTSYESEQSSTEHATELPRITESGHTEVYEPSIHISPAGPSSGTEESLTTQFEQETIKPHLVDKDQTVSMPDTTESLLVTPQEVVSVTEEHDTAPTTPREDSMHEVEPISSIDEMKTTAQPPFVSDVQSQVDQETEKPELQGDEKNQLSTEDEQKPIIPDELPGGSTGTGDLPSPSDDADHQSPDRFPTPGYGTGEQDYEEEDQAFGPGTCRYGGKVYVSAQQIPRDDPCDFCFCFRSDIICLQQSCPPPIHGCHEEPISGFCCPRYECHVSMATTLNMTTTTTTTTTTLPPHFPAHAYKGAAQRRGCHIKGHSYQVGEVVRASSGPCLHCTCGGDGQMKCDPKVCTPEPMLRQMIAAAVSTKRRR